MSEEDTFKRLQRIPLEEMIALAVSRGFKLTVYDLVDVDFQLLLIANHWTPKDFIAAYERRRIGNIQ